MVKILKMFLFFTLFTPCVLYIVFYDICCMFCNPHYCLRELERLVYCLEYWCRDIQDELYHNDPRDKDKWHKDE